MSIYPSPTISTHAFNMCGICHKDLQNVGLSKSCAFCELKKDEPVEAKTTLVNWYVCECCANIHRAIDKVECKVCTELACDSCKYCSLECCADRLLKTRLNILKEEVRQIEEELENRLINEEYGKSNDKVEEGSEDNESDESDESEDAELEDKDSEFDVKGEINTMKSTMGTLFHLVLALNQDEEFKEAIKKIANCDDNADPNENPKVESKVEHSKWCFCSQCINDKEK